MSEIIKRRVAAYCRVSTSKDEQLGSMDSQRRFFIEFISSHPDWIFAGIYCDEGKSGTTTRKREGFNTMLRDCKIGLIDTIITKEVSRFARNTVDVLEYTRLLRRSGVNVVFLNDRIDTAESDGELRLSIMACIAQEESRKTSDRVKWGQKRQMEKGVVFGRDLLGYDVSGGRLYVNESGAETVRLIFRKFALEGRSASAIARELNSLGLPAMRQEKWSSTAILRTLRNEKYVGDLFQGKSFTPDPLDHLKKRQTDPSQLVCISSHHEPIISRELWELTQSRLKTNPPARNSSGKNWCSGKIFCGKCGNPFISRRKSLKYGTYLAWRCSSSQKADGCGCNSVNDKVLLAAVNYILSSLRFCTNELVCEIMREVSFVNNTSARQLDTLISGINQKKITLGKKLASATITDSDYSALIASLNSELQACLYKKQHLIKADMNSETEHFLQQKLSFCVPDKCLCEEIVQTITVCPAKELEIAINGLPCPIRLKYSTKGKGSSFSADFEQL